MLVYVFEVAGKVCYRVLKSICSPSNIGYLSIENREMSSQEEVNQVTNRGPHGLGSIYFINLFLSTFVPAK